MSFDISSSGVIFKEDFLNTNPLWVLNPNIPKACEYKDGKVVLKQVDSRISLSIDLPSLDVYMARIVLTHDPSVPFDYAGIAVYSNDEDIVECQSYFDELEEKSITFKEIRMIYENNHFVFYASSDGLVWEEVGNAEICANRISLFLESYAADRLSSMEVESFEFYRNSKIALEGVSPKVKQVFFYDDQMNEIENIPYSCKDSKLIFDVRNVKLSTVRIMGYDEVDMVMLDEKINIAPGDIYRKNLDMDLYINSQLIETDSMFNIGELSETINYVPAVIVNTHEHKAIKNLRLEIKQYSMFTVGFKNVAISIKDDNKYEKECFISEVPSFGRVELMLRIEKPKDGAASFDNISKFKILLDSI